MRAKQSSPHNLGPRTRAAPRSAYVGAFSCGTMVMVCLSVYLYGDKAKATVERNEPAWGEEKGMEEKGMSPIISPTPFLH